MSKRKQTKTNNYPSFIGESRQISSILRDKEGNILYSKNIDGKICLLKTNIKDIPQILPDSTGRRSFKNVKKIQDIIEQSCASYIHDPCGDDLYMYCIHCEIQDLLPIKEFTTNKSYKHTQYKKDSLGVPCAPQPFCKECKKAYVNEGDAGNKSRSKDQLIEDVGSRTRSKIMESFEPRKKLDLKKIKNKFDNKCFNCSVEITDDKQNIDHTLPHSYYYSFNSDNCTLLCAKCNQEKKDKWPSEFYSEEKLVLLAEKTGYDVNLLRGAKRYNENLINQVAANFEKVIENLLKDLRNQNSKRQIKSLDFLKKDMLKYFRQNPEIAGTILQKIENLREENGK